MEPMLQAYLINTAASSFDILTTGLLHHVTGNPNEKSKDMGIAGNDTLQNAMDELGSFKGALKGESMRRIGFFAIGLIFYLGQNIYTLLTGHQAFPVGETILLGSAAIYAFAGLTNLIPLSYGKKKNIY